MNSMIDLSGKVCLVVGGGTLNLPFADGSAMRFARAIAERLNFTHEG